MVDGTSATPPVARAPAPLSPSMPFCNCAACQHSTARSVVNWYRRLARGPRKRKRALPDAGPPPRPAVPQQTAHQRGLFKANFPACSNPVRASLLRLWSSMGTPRLTLATWVRTLADACERWDGSADGRSSRSIFPFVGSRLGSLTRWPKLRCIPLFAHIPHLSPNQSVSHSPVLRMRFMSLLLPAG